MLTATAGATEYIVKPAPSDQAGVSINGEEVVQLKDFTVYWQFLLWLALMHVLSIIDILLNPAKLIFAILGFRITGRANGLDNPNRDSIYEYIKTRPGAYTNEIVEKIGLDRGGVRHHISTLETQNKIEAHKDGKKIRYFLKNSAYTEKELKILAALQNSTNQKVILEIRNCKCDTNAALACEIGVSRATISWHIRKLKEIGLLKETKKGRSIIYKINSSYKSLIEKYG
ncbi:winged helix-turn-helix transcriptional regulator [Methanosarcina sp. WWM596]|uniref:winged helix-turn-helix transcriptional regulator n=1 Tax=Methanosarcina sp. WWM596 TaxID=1434103 RepID=UPI00061543DF|nr:hypothetical protein MSWHS_1357 [Methanosarcina sp. WWM596]